MTEDPTHWVIIDKKTGRPYLGNKSFVIKEDALRLLDELLKYHRGTDWALRLGVVRGFELKATNTRREGDGRSRNGRPKGCPGNPSVKAKRDLSPNAKMYGS